MDLLDDAHLDRSAIVANCNMNRERTLIGSNGYAKELRFHPLDPLRAIARATGNAAWLDLCCGSGKALIEAAVVLAEEGLSQQCEIVGVDLAGMFAPISGDIHTPRLTKASLTDWQPARQFDLITCVHGLHYIGDKLELIARATSWLTDQGRLVASLDLANIKLTGEVRANRSVLAKLRQNGLRYDARKKLLICEGRRTVTFGLRYLGADDQAGPNYTRQAAVDSYYTWNDE
jgi:SAM-dependent methyltransferase